MSEKKARTFNFEELLGKTIKTAQERDPWTNGRSADRVFFQNFTNSANKDFRIQIFYGKKTGLKFGPLSPDRTLRPRPAGQWIPGQG